MLLYINCCGTNLTVLCESRIEGGALPPIPCQILYTEILAQGFSKTVPGHPPPSFRILLIIY